MPSPFDLCCFSEGFGEKFALFYEEKSKVYIASQAGIFRARHAILHGRLGRILNGMALKPGPNVTDELIIWNTIKFSSFKNDTFIYFMYFNLQQQQRKTRKTSPLKIIPAKTSFEQI